MGQLNTNFICLGVVLSYARSCQTGHNDSNSNSNFDSDCGSNSSCWCDCGSAPTWEHIISLCHFNQTTNNSRCPLLSLSLSFYLTHPPPLAFLLLAWLTFAYFCNSAQSLLDFAFGFAPASVWHVGISSFHTPLHCTLGLASISSRHRFDTSAARQFKWRTRRGSLLMLVNCKYLINLHGYFYAGKSSLLVGVRKRLSVPVPVPVSVSVHIRVGDDVDEPGMQSSLTHTLRLNMWASLSCLPAWSHAVFSVLFSLLCCPHLPVSLSPCPCPLLWLPCIICKQI